MEPTNLLQRILGEFLKDLEHPYNYSQLSRILGVNRQIITGALKILLELGLIKCVNQSQTNKLFLINMPLEYKKLIYRIHQLLNPNRPLTDPDLMALICSEVTLEDEIRYPLEKMLPIEFYDEFEKEEWVQTIDLIINRVLSKGKIKSYYNLLQKQDSSAVYKKLLEDYYGLRLGNYLPFMMRYNLVVIFKTLFEYGLKQFNKSLLLSYLKKHKD